jgi:small subunit ribosomal protein S16
MAVTIRLARFGGKKRPFYRIVVADSRAPRDGRFLDRLGTYDPKQNPARIHFEEKKTLEWINQGAQPSPTVMSLMRQCGLLQKVTEAKPT